MSGFYSIGASVFREGQGLVKHFAPPYAPPAAPSNGVREFDTRRKAAKRMAAVLNGTGPRAEQARQEIGL